MAGKGIPELLNYKQKGKDLNEFIKVPLSEKLAYCFGDPALTLMFTMTTTLLIYFYTNVVGISAGAVGMIMLLSRVFDGFSDVLMGTIIDRTHSKYGKARIWILRLAVPYALAAVLLFTMPPMGNMGKIIYAFVTYNIMNTVVYTAISQPFHALGSLMMILKPVCKFFQCMLFKIVLYAVKADLNIIKTIFLAHLQVCRKRLSFTFQCSCFIKS